TGALGAAGGAAGALGAGGVRAEPARSQQGHDVLEAVADALGAVGVLVLEPGLFLVHGLADLRGEVLAELVGPARPGVAVEDAGAVHEDVGAGEVGADGWAERLDDQPDPRLAEDDAQPGEERVGLGIIFGKARDGL